MKRISRPIVLLAASQLLHPGPLDAQSPRTQTWPLIAGWVVDSKTREPVPEFTVQVCEPADELDLRGPEFRLIRFGKVALVDKLGWHPEHEALPPRLPGTQPEAQVDPVTGLPVLRATARGRIERPPADFSDAPSDDAFFLPGHHFTEGRFAVQSFPIPRNQNQYVNDEVYVRVLSPNYEEKVVGPFPLKSPPRTLRVELVPKPRPPANPTAAVTRRVGRVIGRWEINGRPSSGEHVLVLPRARPNSTERLRNLERFRTTTDSAGRFEISGIPVGPALVYRGVACGAGVTFAAFSEIVVSESSRSETVLDTGGTNSVIGSIDWPNPRPEGMEPGFGMFRASTTSSGMESAEFRPWQVFSRQRGDDYQRLHPVLVGSDGSFRVDGLPDGDYLLRLDFHDVSRRVGQAKAGDLAHYQPTVLGAASIAFSITRQSAPVTDLGKLPLIMTTDPAQSGEPAPPLEFVDSRRVRRTLTEFAGKHVCLVIGEEGTNPEWIMPLIRFGFQNYQDRLVMVRVVHEEQTPEARRLHGVERVLENGWVLASKPRAEIDAWLRKAGISKSTAVLLIDPNGRVKATDARPHDIDFAVLPSFRDSLGR